MSSALTEVELIWIEQRLQRWIRFGHEVEARNLDRRRRVFSFAENAVFAFVRWAANDFGTVVSRLDVLRAVGAGEACSTVGYVRPGAEILLRVSGWPKVQTVLALIDAVEALGIDPAEAAVDYWRQVGNRLAAGQPPRAYTAEQHRAWRLRQAAQP